MSKTVLYHAECNDGIMSAAVVSHFEKDPTIVYRPVHYNQPLPDLTGHDVFMVDFCHNDLGEMLKLAESVNSLVVIDHHDDKADIMESLRKLFYPHVKIVFDVEECGCSATWSYYSDLPLPKSVACVKGFDLHVNKTIQDEYFNLGVLTQGQSIGFWESLLVDEARVNELIIAGRSIHLFMTNTIVPAARLKIRQVRFEGYVIPVVNATRYLQPIILEELARVSGVAMAYEDMTEKRKWSIRSSELAEGAAQRLAKIMGGGGHKNAGGFFTGHDYMFPLIN